MYLHIVYKSSALIFRYELINAATQQVNCWFITVHYREKYRWKLASRLEIKKKKNYKKVMKWDIIIKWQFEIKVINAKGVMNTVCRKYAKTSNCFSEGIKKQDGFIREESSVNQETREL